MLASFLPFFLSSPFLLLAVRFRGGVGFVAHLHPVTCDHLRR